MTNLKAVQKLKLKQAAIRDTQRDRMDEVHSILIHERMAELEGLDASKVSAALWPVRLSKPLC